MMHVVDIIIVTMLGALGLLVTSCSLFLTILIGFEVKDRITRS